VGTPWRGKKRGIFSIKGDWGPLGGKEERSKGIDPHPSGTSSCRGEDGNRGRGGSRKDLSVKRGNGSPGTVRSPQRGRGEGKGTLEGKRDKRPRREEKLYARKKKRSKKGEKKKSQNSNLIE